MELNHQTGEKDLYNSFRGFDPFTLAALAILIFLTFHFGIRSIRSSSESAIGSIPAESERGPLPDSESLKVINQSSSSTSITTSLPDSIIYPYDKFTLTQGPHWATYGHMAIDLAAGAGADIKSPITGKITALYLDEIGNPTLVIENDIYQVTLLHGLYSVYIGQEVEQGQVIGTESNVGNTTDMLGRSCAGRNCGHHTHINIFDKRVGANTNPLKALGG